MESILTSVKNFIGITEEYEVFDQQIIMLINGRFSVLYDLGIGPSEGFRISDKNAAWTDFIEEDNKHMEDVKTYICIKVKLLFDSPTSSAVIEALKEEAKEAEWRLANRDDRTS